MSEVGSIASASAVQPHVCCYPQSDQEADIARGQRGANRDLFTVSARLHLSTLTDVTADIWALRRELGARASQHTDI
jgi:hypothetical protein